MSEFIASAADGEVMTVTFQNSGPVDLAVLAKSLSGLAEQHARYAEEAGASINDDAVRLYVRSIRSGSIIVELVALAKQITTIGGGVSTLVGLAQNLKKAVDYFRGASGTPPEKMTKRDVEDLSALLGPVANDVRGMMQINARDSAQITVNLNIDSTAANAIQNRARNWLALQQEPVSGIRREQLFYFYQARDQAAATAGDRGIIEAISSRPVKTIFASEEAKEALLNEALFTKAYIVDVDVHTVEGQPRLYRILVVHGSVDR